MRELRDELRLGAAAAPVAGVLVDLRTLVDDLEPDQVPSRHAVDLVRVLDRIERVAASAKGQAMRRVAETDLWRRGGARTPAEWLARETGVKTGEAIRVMETATVSADQPDTQEAVRSGEISATQGHSVASATKADPDAGRQLLEDVKARRLTVKETEDEAARIVAAASSESDADRSARHRKGRRLWEGTTADGMGWGRWLAPLAEHARLMAAIGHERDRAFHTARREGRREPTEAYALDGLLALLDRAPADPSSGGVDPDDATHQRAGAGTGTGTPDDGDGASGPAGPADRTGRTKDRGTRRRGPGRSGPWGGAKVIVRIDAAAAQRGHTLPGERSEIAGHGPIPVSDAWDIIDGGALVAAILTHGTDVQRAIHLGRHPTALQRTALEWTTAGTCAIEGCNTTARLEIDHVTDWAASRETTLTELAAVCGHHHDLKTHHGYRFGPTRPNGKRRLVPPELAHHTTEPAPGGAAAAPGDDPAVDRRALTDQAPDDDAPALFDTG